MLLSIGMTLHLTWRSIALCLQGLGPAQRASACLHRLMCCQVEVPIQPACSWIFNFLDASLQVPLQVIKVPCQGPAQTLDKKQGFRSTLRHTSCQSRPSSSVVTCRHCMTEEGFKHI